MEDARRSWWSSHWKWAVPVGCLVLALPCTCGVGLLAVTTFGAVTSAGPYLRAVQIAQADPEVQASLGRDIDPKFRLDGSLSVNQSDGLAIFDIPLAGERAEGTLHVEAEMHGEQWRYRRLEVSTGDGSAIDLVPRLALDDVAPELPPEPEPDLDAFEQGVEDDEGEARESPLEAGPQPGDQQI